MIEGFLAPAGPARARWRAFWRRVDLAVNKCEMLSRGSAGFAHAILLNGDPKNRQP